MTQPLATDFPIDPTTTSGTALADILNRFAGSVGTSNAGATAPAKITGGMLWFDTSVTPAILRVRNAANTSWLVLPNNGDVAGSLTAMGIPNQNLMSVSNTGSLTLGSIANQPAQLLLNKLSTNVANYINGMLNGRPLWQFIMGGADAAGNLSINAFNDAGAFAGTPLTIDRASMRVGVVTAPTGDRGPSVATTLFVGNELAGSPSGNGWQRMPTGAIVEWGEAAITLDAGGNGLVNFPLAYPNKATSVVVGNGDAGPGAGAVFLSLLRTGGWPSKAAFAVHGADKSGTALASWVITVHWASFGN